MQSLRASALRSARQAIRQPLQVQVRGASTQETARNALSAAQQTAGKALESANAVAGRITGGLGGLLGSWRQPIFYNLAVAREVAKQVYIRENLAPPTSIAQLTDAYWSIFAKARDPNYWRGIAQSGEWVTVGVYAVEAYFIFKIGEMIGRRSLVGYPIH